MKKQENDTNSNETKLCKICGEERLIDEFYNRNKSKDGKGTTCKYCIKKYSEDNKEYIREYNLYYQPKYRQENPDKIKYLQIKYYENNKEKLLDKNKTDKKLFKLTHPDYSKNWNELNKEDQNHKRRKRYHSNPNNRIRVVVHSSIYQALKNYNLSKDYNTPIYLGCSIEEFKQHIEQQFLPEMKWENHGEIWEIDHIIPRSSFDFTVEENIFECFHYSNHQPLFKTTEIAELFGYANYIGNRNKGDKIL